jgi:ATP-dependent protease HslVU (ClpYQ) peptidase subunit
MSCVVGIARKDVILIGADLYSCRDNRVMIDVDQKVFGVQGKMIVGYSGNRRAGQVVEQDLHIPRRRKAWSDAQFITKSILPQIVRTIRQHRIYENDEKKTPPDITFLIAYMGSLYRVESAMDISIPKDGYDAIGAGEEYALGSLFSTKKQRDQAKRVQVALQAGAKHCPWVSDGFVLYRLSPHGVEEVQVPCSG